MKVITIVILFASILATILALPASRTDEVELVPPKTTNTNYGDQTVVDTGLFGGWESPFGNPFGGFFDGFEDMMTRMRTQIQDLLEKFPPLSRGNSTDDFDAFPPFPALGGIDLGKGNTTSVTKVIDGHKVVINETDYKKEGDFGGAYVKVRVIDVKSDSGEVITEKEAETVKPNVIVKDKESVENTIENEIPESNEAQLFQTAARKNNYFLHNEKMAFLPKVPNPNSMPSDEVDSFRQQSNPLPVYDEWDEFEPIQPIESNSLYVDEGPPVYYKPFDLSRDTYVNEIQAKKGVRPDPDAEVFDVANVPKVRTHRIDIEVPR